MFSKVTGESTVIKVLVVCVRQAEAGKGEDGGGRVTRCLPNRRERCEGALGGGGAQRHSAPSQRALL